MTAGKSVNSTFMAHCGFCLGHRYNKQRRSCLNEAASWDDDSVCSSSLTAHDDVFDDGVPFCNTDRGKEDDVLSPVSYWILSGKYKWDSTKHHHQSPTLTPKRKTVSVLITHSFTMLQTYSEHLLCALLIAQLLHERAKQTSWMVVVISTDRLKSVHSRRVFEFTSMLLIINFLLVK